MYEPMALHACCIVLIIIIMGRAASSPKAGLYQLAEGRAIPARRRQVYTLALHAIKRAFGAAVAFGGL